jgi:uncharacterized protein HemX
MPPEVNQKKGVIIAIAAILILAVAGVAAYFVFKWKKQQAPPVDIVKKQMEELDALRNQTNPQPLTEEQLKEQSQELNAIRKEYDGVKPKPLTQEELDKQLEDLNNLRSQ